MLLLGRLARSFLGAPALQDQVHFHFWTAAGKFYPVGTRGESVLPATDLRVKEAMGVGVKHGWFSTISVFTRTGLPALVFSHSGPMGASAHPGVSEASPTPAAQPWGRWPRGGSSRWRKHSPTISCSVLGHSYQPTIPSLGRQCCSSCIPARKSQPQLNCAFFQLSWEWRARAVVQAQMGLAMPQGWGLALPGQLWPEAEWQHSQLMWFRNISTLHLLSTERRGKEK